MREVERLRPILLGTEAAFDDIARVARRLVHADVGVVSLVDSDHVAVLGGDGRTTASADELPISDSFSVHCVARRTPVMVDDARFDSLMRQSALVRALGAVGFLGVPVETVPGIAPLALNVYTRSVRKWAHEDIEAMVDCAALVRERVNALSRTARAETWLRTLQTELQLAMRSGCFSTFEWDIPANHIAWSENLEARLGMSPGSFGGTFEAFWQLVHSDDRQHVQQALADALAGRAEYHCEFRMIGGKGSVHRTETWAMIERDESGAPVRMIGVDIDVTRLKA